MTGRNRDGFRSTVTATIRWADRRRETRVAQFMEPEAGSRRLTGIDHPTHGRSTQTMADKVKDPVCGMEIRVEDAAATEEHEGHTFYFCSADCHDTFVKDPHRYGHPTEEHGGHAHH